MSQQNPTIPTPTAAKGIDATIVDLQTHLSFELSWLTNGMGRAYRIKKVRSNGSTQFLPMVYLGTNFANDYFDASPDNDKEGQSIILVGDGSYVDQTRGFYGILEYPVSFIFSANLDTINSTLLATEIFTEHLMENVRQALIRDLLGKPYQLTIDSETIDFDSVYSEFDINTDAGKTNKPLAPMTYFRFDTTVQIRESCPPAALDRCTAIQQNLTADDIANCIIPNYCSVPTYDNDYSINFNGVNQYIEAPTSAVYDLDRLTPFTLSLRIKNTVNVTSALIGKYDSLLGTGRGYYVALIATGKIRVSLQFDGGVNGLAVDTSAALTLGVAYHVACTYDGSSTAAGVKIYIDGVSVATTVVFDTLVSGSLVVASPLVFGSFDSVPLYYNGVLNVARGWDFEMSAANVLADYNGGVPTFPTFLANMIIGNDMGDSGIFGIDTWCFEDESGTVTGYQGKNLTYASRVAAI